MTYLNYEVPVLIVFIVVLLDSVHQLFKLNKKSFIVKVIMLLKVPFDPLCPVGC